MSYGFDYINGVKVEQTVITEDTVIANKHNGSVHVERGRLIISGKLNGSLDVKTGAVVEIFGKQNGSVSVEANAVVIVHGQLNGSTSVEDGGTVVIEFGGRLCGSLSNNGKVIVRGAFGGALSGNDVIMEGSGYIKQPTVRNGVNYYEW